MCGNESGVLSRPGLARLNRNMRHITRQLLYRILAELNEIVHRNRSCVNHRSILEFSRRANGKTGGKESRIGCELQIIRNLFQRDNYTYRTYILQQPILVKSWYALRLCSFHSKFKDTRYISHNHAATTKRNNRPDFIFFLPVLLA